MTASKDDIKLYEEIIHILGRHLEFAHGKLAMIFGLSIPESCLPFPKDMLLKILGVMEIHFNKIGDQRKCKLMQETAATVNGLYKDDEEALLQAANNINNPKWREVMIPNFKKFQDRWARTRHDYMRLVNCGYVGDNSAKLYHIPDCPIAFETPLVNEIWDNNVSTFMRRGMKPCDVCKPPQ
jgi:hypothetical protein